MAQVPTRRNHQVIPAFSFGNRRGEEKETENAHKVKEEEIES
jgi:hypothetical protein